MEDSNEGNLLQVSYLNNSTVIPLIKMGVGASSYPVELDELYGDPMVFKIKRIVHLGSSPCQSFEVLDVFQHPSLLDIFLRSCCSHRASNVGGFFLYVCLSGYLHLLILLLCLLLCSVFYVLVFNFVFSLLKLMLILLIILLLIASLMIPRCLLGLMMLSSWGTITWVPSQRGQGLLSFFFCILRLCFIFFVVI